MVPPTVRKAASLPDISIRIMLRALTEEGLDTRPALEASGLPLGLPPMPGMVSATQEFAFQSAFVRATGYRPGLWVRTGGAYHLPSFGQLGLALMTSSTLDDYLNTSANTRDRDYSLADVRAVIGQPATTGYRIDISNVPESLQEFTLYRDLGAIVTTLRDLWGGHFPLHEIQVALPSPCNDNFTVLGEKVSFDAGQNAIIWDSAHNLRPLHHGDPFLHAAYLEGLKQRSPERGGKNDLVKILEDFITQGLGAELSLTMLAAELGTTERTLQRRLKARDMGFRDLVDAARRRVATELLTTGDMPIAEIAFRIGFSDAISFSQAFRRWTGITPAARRRRDFHATFGQNRGPKVKLSD